MVANDNASNQMPSGAYWFFASGLAPTRWGCHAGFIQPCLSFSFFKENTMSDFNLGRRRVMQAVGAGLLLPGLAPAVIASVKDRPQLTDGTQSGDLLGDRAIVWSRCDRPARMVVEWDT